jgi:hypothetical protein
MSIAIKWKTRPDRAKIVAIYLAPGPQKAIAYRFGITPKTVSKIKTAKQHGHITAPYRMPFNAALITMACGVDL